MDSRLIEIPLIVVDDSPLMRYLWSHHRLLKRVRAFESPEALNAAAERDPDLLAGVAAIVTDNFFDHLSHTTGLEFAAKLRVDGFTKPIFLSSNGDFEQRELTGVITALLPKPIEEALIIIARFV